MSDSPDPQPDDSEQRAIAALGATVLYCDNHCLVVDKPAGLLSQSATPGDDNLLDRTRMYLKIRFEKPGNVFVGLVHRLDRNVSGAIVLARTSKAAKRLSASFAKRGVLKRYVAIVAGLAPERARLEHRIRKREGARGVDVHPLGHAEGQRAVLHLSRLAQQRANALLAIELETGRKHQIRAQLAAAGLPLLGDPLYGHRSPLLRRPALHAALLAFPHPTKDEEVRVVAAIPGDLAAAAQSLGFDTPDRWDFTEDAR